jgi:two-component system, NtrC family, response regulator GlrR
MPAHILIVDDEAEVLELLKEIVEGLGYTVSAANNGAQALAALSAIQPDAILTDLNMPHLSGGELLDRVKARWPELPVIVAAAAADPADVADALARGAFAYLSKPFDLAQLEQVLAAALRQRKA